MFADDLSLISTEEYTGTSKFRLQEALDKLSKWAKNWGLAINTKKNNLLNILSINKTHNDEVNPRQLDTRKK